MSIPVWTHRLTYLFSFLFIPSFLIYLRKLRVVEDTISICRARSIPENATVYILIQISQGISHRAGVPYTPIMRQFKLMPVCPPSRSHVDSSYRFFIKINYFCRFARHVLFLYLFITLHKNVRVKNNYRLTRMCVTSYEVRSESSRIV